jgi:uncharacterized protein YggE
MQATKAIIVSLVLLTAFAAAQEQPTLTAQPNTVYVGADGKFEADPDTAIISCQVSPQENTSKEAYGHATRAVEQVRELLRANGIDPKTAQVGSFSLQPMYDWKSPKQKVIGYRVSTTIVVKLTDFTKVGPLVEGIGNLDVTGNQQLSYTLENIDAAKAKAVEDAFNHARNSALALARAGGRELGSLNYGSVDVQEQVRVMPMKMMGAVAPMGTPAPPPAPTEQFAPQKIQINAHVNAVFNLKPL